jgi:hypothetical protein
MEKINVVVSALLYILKHNGKEILFNNSGYIQIGIFRVYTPKNVDMLSIKLLLLRSKSKSGTIS